MNDLRIAPAASEDLERYIALLEEVADWLEARGIKQWPSGSFRLAADFYAGSIARQEVHLAFLGDALIGTLRVLPRDPIVWPEIVEDDGVYVYSLAVRRQWAERGLGGRMLVWAAERAVTLGRQFVRLDCLAGNEFLPGYYTRAGFSERGEIEARYRYPVGTLRLRRFERGVGGQCEDSKGKPVQFAGSDGW